jgi:hypothetical protein
LKFSSFDIVCFLVLVICYFEICDLLSVGLACLSADRLALAARRGDQE